MQLLWNQTKWRSHATRVVGMLDVLVSQQSCDEKVCDLLHEASLWHGQRCACSRSSVSCSQACFSFVGLWESLLYEPDDTGLSLAWAERLVYVVQEVERSLKLNTCFVVRSYALMSRRLQSAFMSTSFQRVTSWPTTRRGSNPDAMATYDRTTTSPPQAGIKQSAHGVNYWDMHEKHADFGCEVVALARVFVFALCIPVPCDQGRSRTTSSSMTANPCRCFGLINGSTSLLVSNSCNHIATRSRADQCNRCVFIHATQHGCDQLQAVYRSVPSFVHVSPGLQNVNHVQ